MTRIASGSHIAGAEPAVRGFAVELKTSLPVSLLTTITGSGITSSEAFGAGAVSKRLMLTASGLATSEAFGSSLRSFPKGAAGTHPSTTDTRTTVTGPADLSGKNFTNPVTLTGSGITGIGVAFAKKPTFQDVTADLRNVWFDQDGSAGLVSIVGATAATNVTIRAFTALQFKGDMADVDGAFVGTVGFYNGIARPLPQSVTGLTTLTGVGLTSSEVFGSSSASHRNVLTAAGIASSEAFGGSSVLGVGGPDVVTPAAHGPTSPIVTTLSSTTPSYTIQVTAAGTLKRSDTGAVITIAGTEFTGGTLLIATDTPGTRRTVPAGALSNVRVRGGKMILRDVTTTSASGQFEITDSAADFVLELQGWNGVLPHWRAVNCTGGGLRATKSSSGLYPGQNSPAAGAWQAYDLTNPAFPVPTPAGRVDNFTLHAAASGATGPAILIDAGLNIVFGGFDPGTQSTPSGKWPLAVKFDAASRSGGTKVDVQDAYIGAAVDGTSSKIDATSGNYRVWVGVLKRSGIDSAVFLNTLGSRPEKPIWFALTNSVTPGSETSANTTNDRVIADHFVLRNALAQNKVNATFRDGSTKLQEFEVTRTVYNPSASLTLWTPTDIADQWPNGIRRFIHPCAVKGPLGPRPTTAATMPNGLALQNNSILDATWLHMGGASGDGVTEFVDRVFDPDLMVDGSGGAGKRFAASLKNGGAQLVVAPNAAQSGGTAVTLDATTGRTLKVTKPDGTAADFAGWDATGAFGIYTGYADANLGANAVETGVPYRRQLSYTGIDSVAGAFLGVKLVPGPSSTPGALPAPGEDPGIIPDGKVIRIVAGVAETFHPHGMPTGDTVDIATPGLTGTGFTVTRVDDWHFLINGQTAINWNTSGTGVYGTYTPKTVHAYGLAGAQTSIVIPAATTLDDTQNPNMGQPQSNIKLHIKIGAHVRFVRCSLPDISLQSDDATSIVELVDCDQNITPVPGRYDYDAAGKLGVPGKYDPSNQPVSQRTLGTNNAIVTAGALWRVDGHVSFGCHGDFDQGTWLPGSYYNQCHIEHGRDIAGPTSGGSTDRSGIGSSLPKVAAGPHGDIQQWYDFSAPVCTACALATNAHSVFFSRIENVYARYGITIPISAASGSPIQITTTVAQTWTTGTTVGTLDNTGAYVEFVVTRVDSTHFTLQGSTGSAARFVGGYVALPTDRCTVSLDAASGSAKITLPGTSKHNLDNADRIVIKNAADPALNREWPCVKIDSSSVVAQGSVFTVGGTCTLVHAIHLVMPGLYRSDILTTKSIDTSDPLRLSPASSDGNVSINLAVTSLSRGIPASPITAPIPGELDYKVTIRSNRIQTIDGAAGTWNMAIPVAAGDVDLGDGTVIATGTYDPKGFATTTIIEYGTDPDALTSSATGTILTGSGIQPYKVVVKGLAPNTVYWMRAKYVSSQGTSVDSVAPQRVRTPPLVAGATLHVAATGNDTTGNGTSGSPYASIQKALTQAAVGGGDEIRVHAGSYPSQAGSIAIARQFTGNTLVRDAGDGAVHLASISINSARNVVFEGNIDVDGHGLADTSATLLFEVFGSGPTNKAQNIHWAAGAIGDDSKDGDGSGAPVCIRLSSDCDGVFIDNVRAHGCGFAGKAFASTTPTTSYPTRVRFTSVEGVGNSWDAFHPGQVNDFVWTGGSLHDINAPFSTSSSEEHHDGVQAQNGNGMKFVGVRIYDRTHTLAAGDGSAVLLNNDTGGSLSNIKFILCVLESWPGAGINITNGSNLKFLQLTIGNCPGAGHPQGTVINDADFIVSAAATSVTIRGVNARKQYFDSGAPTATIDKNAWRTSAVRPGTNSKVGSVAFVSTIDLHLANSTQAVATGGPTPADDADVVPYDFDGRGFGTNPAIGAYASPAVTTPLANGPATLTVLANENAWTGFGQSGTAIPGGTATPTLSNG